MLKRSEKGLGFEGLEPSKDPMKLLRMTGLTTLDDATLLGALLNLKTQMVGDNVMEGHYAKGTEALRLLAERRK